MQIFEILQNTCTHIDLFCTFYLSSVTFYLSDIFTFFSRMEDEMTKKGHERLRKYDNIVGPTERIQIYDECCEHYDNVSLIYIPHVCIKVLEY